MLTPVPSNHSFEAVRAIARLLLTERLDELATAAQSRLDNEEPAYRKMFADPALKLSGMHRTMRLALTRIAGLTIPAEVAAASSNVGRERAEQGFPLEALVHSFQIDLHVLWEAIIAEGRRMNLTDDPDFLDGLLQVWEATDANSVEVVDAYRRTERDISNFRIGIRDRALERLVLEGEYDPRVVAEASSELGIAANAPVVVIVAKGVPTGHSSITECRHGLREARCSFHFGHIGDELFGIVRSGDRQDQDLHRLLEPLGIWSCGTTNVLGLDCVPRGVRLAKAVLLSESSPGIHPIRSHWIGAIMTSREDLTQLMVEEFISPLLELPMRGDLLETLKVYLRTGSVAEAADVTFRHRNTIRNHLRKVEETTGLQLSIPAESAMLTMAIEWLKTVPGQSFYKSFQIPDSH